MFSPSPLEMKNTNDHQRTTILQVHKSVEIHIVRPRTIHFCQTILILSRDQVPLNSQSVGTLQFQQLPSQTGVVIFMPYFFSHIYLKCYAR